MGDRWQFFGPRRSIRSSELDGPVVLFGDETSFAVARALSDAKRESPVSCVFEVNDVAASTSALERLDLVGATIARQDADGHLEAACTQLLAALEEHPRASLVMTGRAQSIQLVRARLKAKNALRAGKVKAYWSVGKAGLD